MAGSEREVSVNKIKLQGLKRHQKKIPHLAFFNHVL